MKIRSLLLGSVAAAGLSTGAFAADLGVLTSLDVCDALGLSGLTISSDTNCLQITGGVSYEFKWGDYAGSFPVAVTQAGTFSTIAPDGTSPYINDWYTKYEAWIKFVATADSDFGPAKVVIKIKDLYEWQVANEGDLDGDGTIELLEGGGTPGGDDTGGVIFDEAYVSIGDSTVIMAGRKGSIKNVDDDEPFNWLGLFNSEKVDKGVKWASPVDLPDGGHVIQVTSDLGNGVSVSAGLENINDAVAARAGTLIGVIAYKGDGLTAHITGLAGGVLDGEIENYAVHAGFTGTFDAFKVRAAGAWGRNEPTDTDTWNVLASAEATLDLFTIALSGEADGGSTAGVADPTGVGVGGSIGVGITEGVKINLGARWYDSDTSTTDNEGYQIAAQLVAAVTETLTLTGEIGLYGRTGVYGTTLPEDSVFYGSAELAWAPGGGFTSSIKGEAGSNGAYRATFKAAKEFQ